MMGEMKRLLPALTLGVITSIFWAPLVHAAPNLSFRTNLTLPSEGQSTEVRHTIRVSGEGEAALELPVDAVKEATLSTTGANPSSYPLEAKDTETVYRGELIQTTTFSFSAQDDQELVLSYQTDSLLRRFGANGVLLLSTYVKGGEQDKVSVTTPTKLGRPSIFGLKSSDSNFEDGKTRFDFSTKGAQQPIKLIYGSNGLWELNWSSTNLKNGSWWFRTTHVILPPDTNQQRVWLESVTPKPRRLSVDRDGNLVAEYRLWPKRSLTLSAKSYIDVRALFYNTTNTRPLGDVPDELLEYTIRPEGAKPAKDTQVLAQVRKHYDQALESARARKGDVSRLQSDGQKIIVELLEKVRRTGIPAREVSGIALASREQLLNTHQSSSWIEVYIPGTGWMTVDPLGEQYGMADPLHVGLVIFGLPSSTPLSAHTEGLAITPYGQTKLPDPDFGKTHVSMDRFMVVPGLSLNRTEVTLPSGIVLDNAATTVDGRQIAFGSLAPLQQIGRWSTSVGSQSWQGGTVQFGRGGEQGLGEVLAQGTAQPNYLLLATELVILILGTWWFVRRRRQRTAVGKVPPLEKQLDDGTIATDDLLRRQ
jgi:hypothetical protein